MNNKELHGNNPLVSIVVATYNSAKTVTETLDSIKAQTYNNIELIVSDDCSQDNTIDVVSRWIEESKYRFVNARLVTTDKNTGVSGNFHRGIIQSKGQWIKSIAGDDLLIPSAIAEYIDFVSNNPENVRMCVCDVDCFATNGDVNDVEKDIIKRYDRIFEKTKESYSQQRKRIVSELVFAGPTYFYCRDLYNEVGGFKEKYGCAEEWPFVYEVIIRGNRIYSIEKKLVRYRVQNGSLSQSRSKIGHNKRLFDDDFKFFFNKRFIGLIKIGQPLTAWHLAIWLLSKKCKYHIKNERIQSIIKSFLMMFSPLTYIQKIRRICTQK